MDTPPSLLLFLPPFLSFSLPLGIQFLLCARLCVRSHAMLPEGRSGEDGILCRFSLSSLCLSVWLIFFFPVSTLVRFLEPSSNVALLGWLVGRRPCPLNSQPPRLLHRPSNPGHPAPSGRGSWGRTPKSEWLFQASVAVETGCTSLGGPLHHPSATQPMGSEPPQLPGSPPMGRSLGLEPALRRRTPPMSFDPALPLASV